METSDVIKLKEGIKEALKNWTGSKIDVRGKGFVQMRLRM